jgi:hypothetical protein
MGLVMQRLQSTDIQDYIQRSYGSLLHFVQESSYTSHFQITSGSHGDFITCTQKEKPIRVNPVDVSPVDGPTSAHIHLNMHKCGFPSRNLMIKCHDKYKNQVPFPPNFVRTGHRYRDPTAVVSLGARGYRSSRRVQERGYQMSGQATHSTHLDEDLGLQDRSSPENMILEFLNMTGIKIGTIRFDGAKEFGKSVSFQNFCNECGIIMEPVAEYTHVQNAKSENAIRMSKEHVRCLVRDSNLPRTFWPYVLRHFLRLRAY